MGQELFRGRYRLGARLPESGGLPRFAVDGVMLAAPAEGLLVSGTRKWTGLAEIVWARASRQVASPGAQLMVPLAVEQEGDHLLLVHPPLPALTWTEWANRLPTARRLAEIQALLHWLWQATQDHFAVGHLTLSTIWKGVDAPVVSPAAYALPLPLLATCGVIDRGWCPVLAQGEQGGLALAIGSLGADLARIVDRWEPLAAAACEGSGVARDQAAVNTTELASRLRGLEAAARAGDGVAELSELMADMSDGHVFERAHVPGPARKLGRRRTATVSVASKKRRRLLSHLAELARAEHDAALLVASDVLAEAQVREALCSFLPVGSGLGCARGCSHEVLVPPPSRAGRRSPAGWLIIEEDEEGPAVSGARWLTQHTSGQRRVVLLARRQPSLADVLLRLDLASRWGVAVQSASAGLAEIVVTGRLGPATVTLDAPEAPVAASAVKAAASQQEATDKAAIAGQPAGKLDDAQARQERLVLSLLQVAGGSLPLPVLARAVNLEPREFGCLLANLAHNDWLRTGVARVGWHGTVWTGTARLTARGSKRIVELGTSQVEHAAYAQLLLHCVAESRRGTTPDLMWLRFRLLAAMGSDEVGREFGRLLAAVNGGDDEYLAVAACEQALAAPLAGRLNSSLLAKASHYLGRACLARGLTDAAAAIFQRALSALPGEGRQLASAEEGAEIARLVIAQADLLERRGDFPALYEMLRRALADYGSVLPSDVKARLQFELAWAHYRQGRHDLALEICHTLLKQLDVDRQPAATADVYNLIGLISYESSRYEEARIDIQKGLVLRERVGDQAAVARSCNNLGMIYLSLGDLSRAEAFLQRSLEIKQVADDRFGVAGCLLNMAYTALAQGRVDLARARGEQALASSRAHSFQQLVAESLQLLGEVAESEGRFDESAGHYAAAQDLARRIGDNGQCLIAHRHQAGLALRRRAINDAEHHLSEAQALLDRVPSQLQRALLKELAGDLHVQRGSLASAAACFEEAAATLSALHRLDLATRAQAKAALTLLRSGQGLRAKTMVHELRQRSADLRLGALPPEFSEIEQLLAAHDGKALRAPLQGEALIRCLLALPDLEAKHLRFDAFVDQVAESMYGSGSFIGLRFSLLAPTGEDLGRWQRGSGSLVSAPREMEASGPTIQVCRRLPDGTELCAIGELATPAIAEHAEGRRHHLQEIAERALSLAVTLLAVQRWQSQERTPPAAGTGQVNATDSMAGLTPLIGVSDAMAEIRRFIHKVADLDTPVLIFGENGSGKDVVARLIHERSSRRRAPYIAVNCASIPAALLESTLFGHERGAFTDAFARRLGEFEVVGEGTLLLDEIGEMPIELQAKLLRVLEGKEFRRVGGNENLRLKARVLTATNLDLERAVGDGRFRADLYYRLAVIPLRIPALRERPDDIPVLLRHFLEKYAVEFGVPVCQIAPDALAVLLAAPWPGNVRELENLARRLLLFAEGGIIQRRDLPAPLEEAGPGRQTACGSLEELAIAVVRSRVYSLESPLLPRFQNLLARLLVSEIGNKTQAARLLGITPPTLYEWLRRSTVRSEGETDRRK